MQVRAEESVAIKSNLLYDALLNANLGVEFRVAPHWTVDVSGNYNGWKLSHGRQWKHWMVQPELRYRLNSDRMSGHFFAGHIFGGQFNTTLNDFRRQGWATGIGVGYGYSWRFGRHWGLEAEIAVGYAYYRYDKYPCAGCGRKIATRQKNYVGPTKAALNLVYYIGRSKKETPVSQPIAEHVVEIIEEAATDTLPVFNFRLVDVPHSKVLTENLEGVARIQFKVNRTEIDTDFGRNRMELEAIAARLDSIRNTLGMDIRKIELTGYASPEGSYRNNDRLAFERTNSLKDFIQSEIRLDEGVVTVNHVAEDWTGLRDAIQSSGLSDKAEIVAIIDRENDPDAKEAELKRHKDSWKWIDSNVLPRLRRTEYRIEYQHRYEEKELQTLEEVNRNISQGEITEAARLLVDIPSSPEADYARGVVAAMQHRYEEAEAWFRRAQSRGVAESIQALKELKDKTAKN